MADNSLRSEFNNFERKFVLLINEHKKIKENLEILKRENLELKEIIKEKEVIIANFQNIDNINKIVNIMVEEQEDTTGLVDVINNYIEEVDKCIAQLSE